jgi:hypothetical protein
MAINKSQISRSLTVSIIWIIVSSTPVFSHSLRQKQSQTFPNRELKQSLVFAAPPPPPDIGEPGRRAEAGSRSPSCRKEKQLTALVPIDSNSELVFGLTSVSHPSFWFYVPYQPPFTGQFVLRTKKGDLVYSTDVTLPQTPKIINLSVPSTVTPLQVNKQYRWFFKIYNDSQQLCTFVEGWIQRNSLNSGLKTQLEKATLLQRIALYANNGIWFDALNTAAELRRSNPQDSSWAVLLQAVGLNILVNESI